MLSGVLILSSLTFTRKSISIGLVGIVSIAVTLNFDGGGAGQVHVLGQ